MLFKSIVFTLAAVNIASGAVIPTSDTEAVTDIQTLDKRTDGPTTETEALKERNDETPAYTKFLKVRLPELIPDDVNVKARSPEPLTADAGVLLDRAPAALLFGRHHSVCGGNLIAACCQTDLEARDGNGTTTNGTTPTSPVNNPPPTNNGTNSTNTTTPGNNPPPTGGSANCISPGNPAHLKKFRKICAKTGRTAECCSSLVGGTGTGCQDV